MKVLFDKNGQLTLEREVLYNTPIDIGGRDIIIGFNEPAFKSSVQDGAADLDSKLNARLVTYFLPALEIAKMQNKKPRLVLVSGLNVALKWNASTEQEKEQMIINNNLKFDFLSSFFNKFFPGIFSSIQFVVAADPIRVSEDKLIKLWEAIEQKYPEEICKLKFYLARFIKPKLFNEESLSEEAKNYLDSRDPKLLNSFKYAISHVLALADVNFESNFVHNPIGYLSIGGYQERIFNLIRTYAYQILKEEGGNLFGQKIIFKDNLKLILKNQENTPPPYNGYYRKNGDRLFLDEVTYENNRKLDFYDTHKKLRFEMEYMYNNILSKVEYFKFWEGYRQRYLGLKEDYKGA